MILAFSGHRPSGASGVRTFPPTDRILWNLRKITLNYLKKTEPDHCLVGMAQGFDTAAAYSCIDRGIPYTACVPFVGQENTWEAYDQIRYVHLLRNAADIQIVSRTPPGAAGSTQACLSRNRVLVDTADRLCCLFDGNPRGGTSYTVNYATQNNKPIDNLWPEFKRLRVT